MPKRINRFVAVFPKLAVPNDRLVYLQQFTILAALLEQALNLCLDNSDADAKQNTVPQPLQSILNSQITENNQLLKSAFQSKNSGFVVVDFNYLLNCILMLLSKIIVIKPNKHISSNLQAFLNYTKNGIFYECFANLAWKDHYQHFATAFKNFTALQEVARKKRPRSIAYPSGKLAHYFLGHSRQAFSEKQVQQKAQAQAEYEQLLQRVESAVFIDHIVAYCLNNNIPVLSKHDSILCRKSDAKTVRSIMDYFLSHFLGLNGYKLKIN